MAGGLEALATLLFESSPGVDPFTKADSVDEKGKEEWRRDFTGAIIGPGWQQLDSAIKRATDGEGIGPIGNDQNSLTRAELGTAVGMRSAAVFIIINSGPPRAAAAARGLRDR